MKLKTHILRIATICIQICVLTLCIESCSRTGRRPSEAERAIHQIEDSMRAGHMGFAADRLAHLKTETSARNDSDLWARLMVQQAVMGYYSDNPALLKSSADSVARWLEKQKPDTFRISLMAKALQCQSAYYDRFRYDPDSSCHYLRRSVAMLERLGADRNLSVSYGNYANTMRMTGRLDSAAFYYHRAITLADSLRLAPDDYISLYNGIAGVMTDMRDFDHSRKWWDKSMELLPQMGPFDKFNTLTGLGNDLYYRKDYREANKVFTRLMAFLDSVPESRWERMFTGVNLADTYLRLGQPEKATQYLDSARMYFTYEQPNEVCMSYITTLRMREAWLKGDNAGVQRLLAANPVDMQMRPEQLLARLEFLYQYYSESGEPQKALDAHFRYDALLDSMRSSNLRQQISAQDAVYSRDNRILHLQNLNNRNKAHIFGLWMIIAISAAVILAVCIILIIRRLRQRRREDRMMAKIIQLRSENLRNRITPHFIYNALNHVMSRQDSGRQSDLSALVRLIRHQQSVASEMLVPLSEELAFVDDYVSVMSESVGGVLDYACQIGEGLDPAHILFPSMAIQIMAENAFKHAFPKLSQGTDRVLRIEVRRKEDGTLTATVFNNTAAAATTPGVGNGLRIILDSIHVINERSHMGISFSVNPAASVAGIEGYLADITIARPATTDKTL